MNTPESIRVLPFRCAETSRRFVVIFGRQSSQVRYTIIKIVDEKNATPEEAAYLKAPSPLESMLVPLQNTLTTDILPTINNVVDRFKALVVGNSTQGNSKSQQKAKPSAEPKAKARPDTGNYNIDDFDFKGWYCPCCGFAKDKWVPSRFIRCGRCHEYICGARIRLLPDGNKMFVCHDGCGNQGILGGGMLTSMDALSVNNKKPGELPDRQTPKLPTSSQLALPPAKKKKD